jgi:hypothetical protein
MAMGVFMMLSADYVIGTRGDLKVAANEVAIGLTLPRVASAMLGHRLVRAAFQRAAILSEYFDVESADSGGCPHSRLTISPNLPRSTRRLERAPFRCRFTPTTNPAKAGFGNAWPLDQRTTSGTGAETGQMRPPRISFPFGLKSSVRPLYLD